MAKVSAVNKNDKRIKLSDKLYKKRQSLKKIIMDKKLPLEERFKANKNYLKCQEILQKLELWIDVKLQEDLMGYIEN